MGTPPCPWEGCSRLTVLNIKKLFLISWRNFSKCNLYPYDEHNIDEHNNTALHPYCPENHQRHTPLLLQESSVSLSYLYNLEYFPGPVGEKLYWYNFPLWGIFRDKIIHFCYYNKKILKEMNATFFLYQSWRTWPMICDTTSSSKSLLRTELILQIHSAEGKTRTFKTFLSR